MIEKKRQIVTKINNYKDEQIVSHSNVMSYLMSHSILRMAVSSYSVIIFTHIRNNQNHNSGGGKNK